MPKKDFLTPRERSARMARIKSRGTAPEIALTKILRKARVKFRRHVTSLPGTPDFALRDGLVVVFVDGEFWHGRKLASWQHKLDKYWLRKIMGNVRRDRRNHAKLRKLGWAVVRIWESQLKETPEKCLARIRVTLTPGVVTQ